MDEAEALERLGKKDEAALVWLIERYAPYVNTVIYNIIGTVVSPCDVEEVASDVFLVLWQNAAAVQEGKLKAYLGAVARNKAREKLRSLGGELPLEEDEYYTTKDGVRAAIQMETSHTGKSLFWVDVSMGEIDFSMFGTQVELDEIHTILDSLELSQMTGSFTGN